MPPVFRFAPSPNGLLHLGHAYSALLNFDLARRAGGQLLLRIEDIDATRCRPEFEAAIFEDLGWLGIAWEAAGAAAIRTSRGLPRSGAAAGGAGPALSGVREPGRDRAAGGAARGRRRVAARSRRRAALSGCGEVAAGADERARLIASGAPYALRLDMVAAYRARRRSRLARAGRGARAARPARVTADPLAWGDVVLARKETPTSYHLSVVIDDALQGVTDVVRGPGPVLVDQRASPAAAAARSAAAGLPPSPADPRRCRPQACRSRRRRPGLRELRDRGLTPADIHRLVGLTSVTPAAAPWHGGMGGAENHGAEIAQQADAGQAKANEASARPRRRSKKRVPKPAARKAPAKARRSRGPNPAWSRRRWPRSPMRCARR